MGSLDIVCPVFSEPEGIRGFHEQLCAALAGLEVRYRLRFIYVLDPSPDRTETVLAEIAHGDARVSVLVMSRRFGHQAALVAGIDESRADALVMLDSDLQHPPKLIIDFVRHWEEGADIVQAVRQDGDETRWLTRVTSRLFYATLLKIGAVQIPSGAADFRLLARRIVEVLRNDLREHNPFLRGLVSWIGYRIVYVPFQPDRRSKGRSKYGASALLNFAANGILSFSKAPLRLCIGAGLALGVLSVVSGIAQILIYFTSDITVPGWASLFAAVSLIGGIQLFFLGVLGEYVGLVFDETKRRPIYLIDRRYAASHGIGSSGPTAADPEGVATPDSGPREA